jgi:hypothetical protein
MVNEWLDAFNETYRMREFDMGIERRLICPTRVNEE